MQLNIARSEELDYKPENLNGDVYVEEKFKNYTPHVEVNIKTENYTLTTMIGLKDLKEVFLMRHLIFFIETGIATNPTYEFDNFDLTSDHIIVRHNQSGQVCATCRILTENTCTKFYSEEEFHLAEFLKEPGVKMEFGRACIHPDHRNGALKDLLWKGIGQYILKIKADVLFGCTSVMINSSQLVSSIVRMLKDNDLYSDKYGISPNPKYKMNYLEDVSNVPYDKKALFEHLPPLLKSYFLAGAKIYGNPAFDKEFNCIDFFTIIFLNQLNPSFQKRYVSGM